MTTILSKSELKSLMASSGDTHVSIYMPTIRAGRETRQNRIRLKNLVKDAEKRLIEMGYRVPDAQALLRPSERLLGPTDYWLSPGDGLAMFLSADTVQQYSLPIRLKKRLIITDRFHVKPLISLFTGDNPFFILALSQNEARLLQGTRSAVGEVELENAPESLSSILRAETPERHLNWYSPPGAPGRQAAIFHGIGGGKDRDRAKLLDYLRQVDAGLRTILKDEQAPLVLAGVDYLRALYQEISSYPHVLETGIPGNPEQRSADELHAEAWRILQPYFRKTKRAARNHYRQLAGQGSQLASDQIERILPAAIHGQVEFLFVALGAHLWGEFDPVSLRVDQKEAHQPGSEDLLDRAAVETFLNGGKVFAVRPDRVPSRNLAAAVFRY